MGTWDQVMDEYGEGKGMIVVGEIAAKWFRPIPLEGDDPQVFSNIVKGWDLINAHRIQSDLDAGLETFSLEQLVHVLPTWYVFAKAYVWDDEDKDAVNVIKLHEVITASIKHHSAQTVYAYLTRECERAREDVKASIQALYACDEEDWERSSSLSRNVLKTCNQWLHAVAAYDRIGVGYDFLLSLKLHNELEYMTDEVLPHKGMLTKWAERYILGALTSYDVSTDPNQWLYVDGTTFDFWLEFARARDRYLVSCAATTSGEDEWDRLVAQYVKDRHAQEEL